MHGNQCSVELPPEHGSLPLPNVVSDSGLLGSLPILATQANCDSHELEVSVFFFGGGADQDELVQPAHRMVLEMALMIKVQSCPGLQ